MRERLLSILFLAFSFIISFFPSAYAFDDAKALPPIELGGPNQAPKFDSLAGFLDYSNTHNNNYGIPGKITKYPRMTLANLDDDILFIKGTSAVGIQYVGLIRNILLHIGVCYDYSNLINLSLDNSMMEKPEYDPELLSSANTKMDFMSPRPFYARIMLSW
jgi:hypothetical protein